MAPPAALNWGPEAPLFIGMFVALLLAFLMQPLRKMWDYDRNSQHSLRRNPLSEMSIIWSDRRLRYLGFVAFCFAAIQLCLTTFAVTMLVDDLNFSLIESGVILAILHIAGVTGRLWWGWLADRLNDGNATLLMIALLSVIFAVITGQLSADLPHIWVYLLMASFSFAAVGWNGVFMAEIARTAPKETTSKATGAVLVMSFTGILLGPPAFTIIHGIIGSYLNTFVVFAIVSAVGGVFLLRIRSWKDQNFSI